MDPWWRKLCVESLGKVPEPKSYEQVRLVKLTLPWLRFKWGSTINVWGGGYVAGKNQEVRWLGQGGTYQSSAKYRTATILPATKNRWQMLDQEVYGFGTVFLTFSSNFYVKVVLHMGRILSAGLGPTVPPHLHQLCNIHGYRCRWPYGLTS